MKEILFRGKRVDNGEWIEGYYAHYASLNRHCIYIGEPCKNGTMEFGGKQWEVIPGTVGQYTGLTDKDGKKIFEGDIILINDDAKGAVYYEKTVAAFCVKGHIFYNGIWQKDYNQHLNYLLWVKEKLSILQVIGNAYDNPELLEEQK